MGDQVAALKRGDAVAFTATWEQYRAPLYRFLARMVRRREVAEELLQETFLRLARRAPDLADDTDLAAWLFTVARNLCRSHLRWSLLEADTLRSLWGWRTRSATTPFEAAAHEESERALERALGRLSAKDREILLLVGVEGLTPAQAARILELSPEAARQRLSRARARLSAQLGENAPAGYLVPLGQSGQERSR